MGGAGGRRAAGRQERRPTMTACPQRNRGDNVRGTFLERHLSTRHSILLLSLLRRTEAGTHYKAPRAGGAERGREGGGRGRRRAAACWLACWLTPLDWPDCYCCCCYLLHSHLCVKMSAARLAPPAPLPPPGPVRSPPSGRPCLRSVPCPGHTGRAPPPTTCPCGPAVSGPSPCPAAARPEARGARGGGSGPTAVITGKRQAGEAGKEATSERTGV